MHRESPAATTNPESTRQACEMELSRYQMEIRASSKAISKQYGGLALDLVSAPAIEAYIERIFSLCGDLTVGKRNCTSKSLEMRVFLKLNYHISHP